MTLASDLPGALPIDPVLQGHKSYICYDETGKVIAKCDISEATRAFMVQSGRLLIESGADPSTVYVKDGAVEQRPECPAALNGMTINAVPVPAKILIGTTLYDCDEDHVDLSFDESGTHLVRVISWPYLDKEFSVEAAPQ